MKAIENLTGALALVLMPINMLGGIVAGIWLAILGEWGSIGYGLMFGIGGAFLIGLAMMPGMLFAGPAVMLHEKGNRFGFYTFGFLSTLYQVAVLSTWCMFILFFFAKRADASSAIPLLLWSYGAATGPIAYLAQKDLQSGNEYATISAFFSQAGFLLVAIVILVARPSNLTVLLIFGAVMLIAMLFQLASAFSQERAARSFGRT